MARSRVCHDQLVCVPLWYGSFTCVPRPNGMCVVDPTWKLEFAKMYATVGTIDLGTNQSEPTSDYGLRNRENPSEPTTPLPSPQYGKAEASEISDTLCWINFSDFSSGATRFGKSEKLSQQKVPHILLDCDFPYCGLGRGIVGSEGFFRFPSPQSLVGSDWFVLKSIVPAVPVCHKSSVKMGCLCGNAWGNVRGKRMWKETDQFLLTNIMAGHW